MKLKRAVILGLLCVSSMATIAQWQWVDKNGNKVYSDLPPPPDIPEKSIPKPIPGKPPPARAVTPAPVGAVPTAASPAPATVAAPAPASAAASAPRPAGKDPELEEKRKQAEQAEAARKQAEDDKVRKTRADNCSRARQAKATLDSGYRVATVDKAGERIVLDDDARAAESKRLQGVIQSECN